MKSLLKHDFYRILKSKVSLVILIISLSLPLLICLMYFGLSQIIKSMGEADPEMDTLFNARSIIGSVYTVSQNIGIVIPIIGIIFVGNDISGGSLRNKIIAGKKRSQIYLSYLITTCVFNIVIITIYFLAMTGFSLIFFKYGSPFDQLEFRNLIFYFVSGTFTFMFVGSVTTALTTLFKSKAPAIILTFVLLLALSLVITVISLIPTEKINDYLFFIPTHLTTQFSYLKNEIALLLTEGGGKNFTWLNFIFSIIGTIFFSTINTIIGIFTFKNKEIK